MYNTKKASRKLRGMAADDIFVLLEDLPPEDRSVVIDGAGRHGQGLHLVRHDDKTRSLGTLVAIVRMVALRTNL